jgi:hypothetical protein
VQLARDGHKAKLTVDGVSSDGRYLNEGRWRLKLTTPDGAVHERDLSLVAPGRYETEFDLPALGVYECVLQETQSADVPSGGTPSADVSAGPAERRALVLDYPDECRLPSGDESLLRQACLLSGGTFDPRPEDVLTDSVLAGSVLADSELADSVLVHGGQTPQRAVPLWPYLVLAAVAVMLLDAVDRRFGRGDD